MPLKELSQGGFAAIVASVFSGNKGVLFIAVDKFGVGDGDGSKFLEAVKTTPAGK